MILSKAKNSEENFLLSDISDNLVSKLEVSSLISDHHMVDYYLSLSKPPLPREVRSYRCYKAIDTLELQQEIENSSLLINPAKTLDAQLDQYTKLCPTL